MSYYTREVNSSVSSTWQPGRLPSAWEPGVYESQIYQLWLQRQYFTAQPQSSKPAFTIIMPPPNVNGNLHSGHAFESTISDIICRVKRAQGYDVLWLPGTDHAGIATQIAVEKELATKNIAKSTMSREDFIAYAHDFTDRVRGNILTQIQALGVSADWSRIRFTLDEQLSYAVRTIFKQLYDAGLIYRAERLVNWSPTLRSAISDLEVDYREVDGELVSFRYGNDSDTIVVATTRVETILGDTAIAVHPEDERYTHLVGTQIAHPFLPRTVVVVADDQVDKDFGTGAVKITPAHDPFDFDLAARHGLELCTVIDRDGKICNTDTEFDGLDRFEARIKIREALRDQDRIVSEIRPYVHSVAHSERSGEPLEPLISLQWWVKTDTLAASSAAAVRSGETVIHPQAQNARWFDWVDNMRDWCISRQLWWGHRIPVWYGPDGQILVPDPDQEVPEGYVQDDDVLDTWFSSALFPFSTLGWPHNTEDLQRYYPTDLMNTGHDLIFFWVARMMMFARFVAGKVPGVTPLIPHMGDVPFKDVFLHGLVRDEYGAKMSKSKGNGVDPLVFIEQFGVDAARFTFARAANPGSDLNLGNSAGELSRNFVTKIFNAIKFAIINGAVIEPLPDSEQLTTADQWILGRLSETINQVTNDCEQYQLGRASDALYHFAWDDVCDWYIECAKIQSQAGRAEQTRIVLGFVCDHLLRLLHPFTPFVTEILWLALHSGNGKRENLVESIVCAPWPAYVADFSSADVIFGDAQKIITEIRRFRNDQGIKSSTILPARFSTYQLPGDVVELIAAMTKIDLTAPCTPTGFSEIRLTHGIFTFELDTSQAIDKKAEKTKLEKELAQAHKDLTSSTDRLSNENFIAKAPPDVVAKIKQRAIAAQQEVDRITDRLARL